MKILRLFLLLWLAVTAALAAPAKDAHVVILSIDGLPAYMLEDARLPMPTLSRLAREGAIAQGMRTINPTVTWPSHTAMITGVNAARHHVLFNGLLTRPTPGAAYKVEPWRDKSDLVHAPTVYDIAYRAGLTTAQVDWVAITNPGTITWEFPEVPRVDGALVREMIDAGAVSRNDILDFSRGNITWRDRVWTDAAEFITLRHKPNLGLYHLLNLDSTHHRYGPRSLAGSSAMAFADDRLRQLLEALRAAGILEKTTVLVVSDHGFKTVRRNIRAAVALKQQGLAGVTVIPEGGTANVYIHDPAERARLTPRLQETFAAIEGVQHVYLPAEYALLGLPTPEQSSQGPDLLLAARNGYAFTGGSDGVVVAPQQPESGSHGYLNTDPEMQAIFVAYGRGVKPGTKLGVIDVRDVAPTIAKLLGLAMDNVEGRPLF
jgi:predicted AlkP superfamily pyrophosphatase or phosphodiesterase